VSLSWGGPATFLHRYEAGKRQLEAEFGVELVEMSHTLADPDFVAANPRLELAICIRRSRIRASTGSSRRSVVTTRSGCCGCSTST
jgi:hypothetical protein